MISDKKLLFLHEEGFLPGPNEDEKAFLLRIEQTKKLFDSPQDFFASVEKKTGFSIQDVGKRAHLSWIKSQLKELFDVNPQYLFFFFENKKLSFFQGAATWLFDMGSYCFPLIQMRKKLKKGAYLKLYSLEEILSHEAIHACRIAYDEPGTEEFFAYMGSTNLFRRTFGPIIKKTSDILVFFGMFFLGCLFLFLKSNLSFFFFSIGSIWLSLGLIRLFLTRFKLLRTHKKLCGLLKDKKKARHLLFRLTDNEIDSFSRASLDTIIEMIWKQKTKTLRWRLLYLKYFLEIFLK